MNRNKVLFRGKDSGIINRHELLAPYRIMDTPAEVAFNDIVRLAAQVCEVPAAFITFVDDERQFFKASIGIGEVSDAVQRTGFCPFTVAKQSTLVIPDAHADIRYAHNPAVISSPFVRFYAGVPVCSSEGEVLGTLCVVDQKPREISDEKLDSLRGLARQVETLLSLRRLVYSQAELIAERGRLEHLAQQRASELEAVIEDMPAGVYIGGQDGITLCNRLGLEMLGFSSLEDMQANIAHLAGRLETRFLDTGERVKPGEDIFVRAFLYGERTSREVELRHIESGRTVIIDSAVAPVYDGTKIVAAVAVNLDVTKQKSAQAEARRNTDRLRLAMEAGRLGAFALDLATGQIDCTDQCRSNYGFPADSRLPHKALLAMILEEDRPLAHAAMQRALHESVDYVVEYRIQTPQEQIRWIALRGLVVHSADGKPTGVIGVTQDITEQRQAADALRVSEAALQERERRIRALYELTSRIDLPFNDKVKQLLDLGRDWLGITCGVVAHIDFAAQSYEIIHGCADDNRFADGFKTSLERTTCSETAKMSPESAALAFEHAGAHPFWKHHLSYKLYGTEAYIASVLWGNHGRWGTLAFFAQTPRPEPFTEFDKDLVRLMAQWIGGELARQETEAELRRNTAQQRRFVRDMLASVTEGKLCLCETEEDLPEPLEAASEPMVLKTQTLRKLRQCVDDVATDRAFSEGRKQDLLTAVGEASMNAVRHAGGGIGQVFINKEKGILQVRIQDHGTGIREEDLHRATLEKGWSGTDSFGHGFFLMLRTVDRTYLLTGTSGTTVILEQELTPPAPAWWQSMSG